MLRQLHRLAAPTKVEEEAQCLSVSSACVSASPKQDKLRRHPRQSGPRRSQVDHVPSRPGTPKTPTRKLSTSPHRTKPFENQMRAKRSMPTRKIHGVTESSTIVTPPPSPRCCPSTTSSPKKAGQTYLPPPKSPLRLTLRRKASKPPKKSKSQIIREQVEEKYDDNGTLQRTTVTRIRNSDGSSSTEKHKECLSPTSPRFRPKPKVNQIKFLSKSNDKPSMLQERRTNKKFVNNVRCWKVFVGVYYDFYYSVVLCLPHGSKATTEIVWHGMKAPSVSFQVSGVSKSSLMEILLFLAESYLFRICKTRRFKIIEWSLIK
jgi:hypothetical protein